MRFRVHMPTRSRPAKALTQMMQFLRLARREKHVVLGSFSIDRDDPTTNNDGVIERMRRMGCTVHIGDNTTKVQACNAGIERDFDVLILTSDDMTPVMTHWDERLAKDMLEHFPNCDGALHYDDGHTGAGLCTLPVMGVNLYKKFGYVYHPAYTSLACDNEWSDLLRSRRRLVYFKQPLCRHDHFSHGAAPNDDLYRRNESFMGPDSALYHARKARGFDAPPIEFSILIASLHKRREMLTSLLGALNDQINAKEHNPRVEIVVDADAGAEPIGAKRQRMLEKSLGRYIAFIDDDDAVSPRYVDLVMAALAKEPDCVGLIGEITDDGRNPREFRHSATYTHWYTDKGPDGRDLYIRTPNHLNPVRRELALKAGFGTETFGEDHAYSNRLAALLRGLGRPVRENMPAETLYFYKCRSVK